MATIPPFVRCASLLILLGLAACGNEAVNHTADVSQPQSCHTALTLDHSFDPQADIDQLREAVERPDNLDALEQLGWRYMSLARDGDGAAALFLVGETVRCMLDHVADSPQARLLQANYRQQVHDFTGAEALAKELVKERGGWFDYAVLGDALMEQGRLAEAEAAYQSMVDLKPGAESYGRIAQLRWLNGDQDGAMEMMVLAIRAQHAGDHRAAAWWRTGLAGYLLETGRADAALTVVDQSLQFHPESHAAHYLRARTLNAMGRTADAISAIESAVALNPLPEYEQMLTEWLTAGPQPFSPPA